MRPATAAWALAPPKAQSRGGAFICARETPDPLREGPHAELHGYLETFPQEPFGPILVSSSPARDQRFRAIGAAPRKRGLHLRPAIEPECIPEVTNGLGGVTHGQVEVAHGFWPRRWQSYEPAALLPGAPATQKFRAADGSQEC